MRLTSEVGGHGGTQISLPWLVGWTRWAWRRGRTRGPKTPPPLLWWSSDPGASPWPTTPLTALKPIKDMHIRNAQQKSVETARDALLFVTALTGMSQAERPETQVWCSVGNAAQAVLYGVNGLVQEHVGKVKLQNSSNNIADITLDATIQWPHPLFGACSPAKP